MTNILYLHGFNSSPESVKALQSKGYFAEHTPTVNFYCPQLKNTPNAVVKQLENLIEKFPDKQWSLIGSSLGGYFATYLAEKYHLSAVLINPAVKPFKLLHQYFGEQCNPYTGISYQITPHFINDLKAIEQKCLSRKNNYFVMVQTHDEVLDYQQAIKKYQNQHIMVQQGGDHNFVDYEKMLPAIAKFLQLT